MAGWDPGKYGKPASKQEENKPSNDHNRVTTDHNGLAHLGKYRAWMEKLANEYGGNTFASRKELVKTSYVDKVLHADSCDAAEQSQLSSEISKPYPSSLKPIQTRRALELPSYEEQRQRSTPRLVCDQILTKSSFERHLEHSSDNPPQEMKEPYTHHRQAARRVTEEKGTRPYDPTCPAISPYNQNAATPSIEKQIRDAQDESLRKITGRKIDNDKNTTVSRKDLDLARTIVRSDHPHLSHQSCNQELSPSFKRQKVSGSPQSPTLRGCTAGPISPASSRKPSTMLAVSEIQHLQLPQFKAEKSLSSSKWAPKEDIRSLTARVTRNSNAWGSVVASDATKESHRTGETFGKLLCNEEANDEDLPQLDWEGKLLPPPTDWHDRRRFNNNNPHFKTRFIEWRPAVNDDFSLSWFNNGIPYIVVPPQQLRDPHNLPDGIGLVQKTFTISYESARHYGYVKDPTDATKYAGPVDAEDFADWGKLDLSMPQNKKYKDETTDGLVANWLRHHEITQKSHLTPPTHVSYRTGPKALPIPMDEEMERVQPERHRPKFNMYLRPAVASDVKELTRIYNWHIHNGPRTAEVHLTSENEMRIRLDSAKGSKLPFIVAVPKKQKYSPAMELDKGSAAFLRANPHHPAENIQRKHRAVTRIEKLAGWASAQDLTAIDYVEHISAEIEVYVDPAYQTMGVGACLMDKIIEACDRGYKPRLDYQFYCAQELRHLYNSGGGRDIHKTFILLRKWSFPLTDVTTTRCKLSKLDRTFTESEDNYEQRVGKWLESWGFQVEGKLSAIGAKNGRFLDLVYFSRETQWQPVDGKIPDPLLSFDDYERENEDQEDDGR